MTRFVVRAALAACLALATTACKEAAGPQAGTAVSVKDNTFDPQALLVTAGQTVTWTWNGSNPHTVTFDAGGTNSASLTTGTFQRQFPAAGTFAYHCLVHGTAMSGTITVQ